MSDVMISDFILSSSPLFASLSHWELEEIVAKVTTQRFQKGETIFHRGDVGDRLYIVKYGAVYISVNGNDGQRTTIARLGRGDCFGEMSLLSGEPRSADAIAMSEVELLVLRQRDFLQVMTTCPALTRNIGRVLSERLKRSNEQFVHPHKVGDLTVLAGLAEGETTGLLALNVAVSLASQSRARVLLLLDTNGKTGQTARHGLNSLPSCAQIYRDRELIQRHQQETGQPRLGGLSVATLAEEGHGDLDPELLIATLDWLREIYNHVLVAADLTTSPALVAILKQAQRVVIFAPADSIASAPDCLRDVADCLGGKEKTGFVLLEASGNNGSARPTQIVEWPVRRRFSTGTAGLVDSKPGEPYVLAEPRSVLSREIDWIARDIGRLKVGLALGAGGAKGYALLGALQVLEQAGVPFDYLSGTSIGALLGAWLGTGITVTAAGQLMDECFNPEAVKKIFALSLSGFSVSGSQEMAALLERTIGDRQFCELNIPLVVMAVNLRSRQEVALQEGLVRQAVQASTSLPGTFPPLPMGDMLLVDGVTLNPVPSIPIRGLGADLVIGINLISRNQLPAWPGEELPAEQPAARKGPQMLESLFQVMDIMQSETSERCAALADVVITPLFGPCSWRDFQRAGQFYAAGQDAARQALPAVRQLLPWLAV